MSVEEPPPQAGVAGGGSVGLPSLRALSLANARRQPLPSLLLPSPLAQLTSPLLPSPISAVSTCASASANEAPRSSTPGDVAAAPSSALAPVPAPPPVPGANTWPNWVSPTPIVAPAPPAPWPCGANPGRAPSSTPRSTVLDLAGPCFSAAGRTAWRSRPPTPSWTRASELNVQPSLPYGGHGSVPPLPSSSAVMVEEPSLKKARPDPSGNGILRGAPSGCPVQAHQQVGPTPSDGSMLRAYAGSPSQPHQQVGPPHSDGGTVRASSGCPLQPHQQQHFGPPPPRMSEAGPQSEAPFFPPLRHHSRAITTESPATASEAAAAAGAASSAFIRMRTPAGERMDTLTLRLKLFSAQTHVPDACLHALAIPCA